MPLEVDRKNTDMTATGGSLGYPKAPSNLEFRSRTEEGSGSIGKYHGVGRGESNPRGSPNSKEDSDRTTRTNRWKQ